MHHVAASGRGPSPWRAPDAPWPRTGADWLLVVAALQLAAILLFSLPLAYLALWVYFGWSESACDDCTRLLIQSAAWATVIGLAAFAVLAAWRHRRADRPHRLALVALAAPPIAALAEIQLLLL